VKVRILLFGPESAALSRSHVELEIPSPATCHSLREHLGTAFPALGPSLAAARLAINGRFAGPDHPITPADEIALIGLVSGG
jgi:molybdopterin converting factor small subunit